MLSDLTPSTTTNRDDLPLEAMEPTPREVELELVGRLLSGDDRAWREFHARFDRLIYRCITKVTARFATVVGPEDIREIYATLLIQLLANDMHKLRSFDPDRGNRLGSWIGMLAINAAYDYLRGMRRESNRASITEAESLSSDLPDPFEQCDRKQRARLVAELLSEFSEKDREFLALYFGEGLEPDEIAERMGISVKTVYSKKHKIQSRLEAMLARTRLAA
jgi:RNA polymerase sigma-70 factor (ECF subfamily)